MPPMTAACEWMPPEGDDPMPSDQPTRGAVAPARRLRPPGLRDPRLILGVVVMALSVLTGALLIGDHDRVHTALVLRHDIRAGESVGPGDVRRVRVDLSGAAGSRYFLDGAGPSPGRRADREMAAGELLPRSAVSAGTDSALTQLPLSVAADDLPAGVRVGSTVDVWVLPEGVRAQAEPRAQLVLGEVPVMRIGGGGSALAPESTRQVIVGVSASGEGRQRVVASALGRAASGRVLITSRG